MGDGLIERLNDEAWRAACVAHACAVQTGRTDGPVWLEWSERAIWKAEAAQPLFAHPAEPAARDEGEAERVFTVSPSGGGWPVTIIPSKVESFNAKGCNSDERRVVMVSGESYRLRRGDADAIMAARAAGGEK